MNSEQLTSDGKRKMAAKGRHQIEAQAKSWQGCKDGYKRDVSRRR